MAGAEGITVVGLAVRFDLGRYHATPWGAHVNDGRVEWPPSAWRILRALYAVSRSHVGLASRRADADAVLVRLAAAPPPTYEMPASAAAHTRHYFPSRLQSPSRPGKTDRVLDAFHAVDPEAELRVWWEADLHDAEREALAALTRTLGYLGRSESVCSARLLAEEPPGEPDALPRAQLAADEPGEVVELLCLDGGEGTIDALTCSVGDLRRRRRLVPSGTRLVEYALRHHWPSPAARPAPERPTLARYRLHGGSRPGIREAVAIGEALRAAVQGRHGRRHDGAASPVFSGRAGERPRADQHRHAHYIATPGADGRRIDHLVVWAPEGFGPAEVDSLASLTEIRTRGLPEPLRIALTAVGSTELVLPELMGPSRRWTSLTPFGLTRHPKRRGGRIVDAPEDQIRRELALRDLPEPVEIELVRGGWSEFRRSRIFDSRLGAPRVVGATVRFEEELGGPIALGALSHFGLGLFLPA
ncbi:MAG: type I-U CRISPR-associated protein Csb2 [Thermoleophilaceae bacterium]